MPLCGLQMHNFGTVDAIRIQFGSTWIATSLVKESNLASKAALDSTIGHDDARVQGHDDDVMSYVAALRGLAVTCDFRDLCDSLIRDQIVRCTSNSKVKEKLYPWIRC
ncbi:hypothetical protein NDU88_002172 [Pleurodeles waltl]|uniref:Uncharacterized protein n=1 Tax=Pleurodeles waltl TaxID=8319 RepID=A0AAV7W144_PLEWA|nr:hypothetical protein NDU88_002172 [Pleurodeles waltl]